MNKCRAIEYICGKHIKDPVNISCEADENIYIDNDDNPNSNDKQEDIQRNKNFVEAVQKVILRLRCERIIEMFKSLKKDREIFDQECFKFNQDEENCLYRYHILNSS